MNPYEIGIMADSLYNSYEHYFGKRDRPMHPTSLRSFHNALRILRSLDYHELSFLTDKEWEHFRDRPYDFFITTSDDYAARIWAAIQKRQPQKLKELPIYQMIINNTPDHAEHDWLILKNGNVIAGFATSNTAERFIVEREAQQ